MAFILPDLPYDRDGLSPHISEDTLNFHHGKHHNAYVVNLNKLVEGTDLADASLEEVVKISATDPAKAGMFNNAAQVWNHTFYWHSMKPGGGGLPHGKIAELIDRDFGSYEAFEPSLKLRAAVSLGRAGPGSCSRMASSASRARQMRKRR